MKKITITLVFIITLVGSVFAGNGEVKNEILKAFTSRFANAKEVSWVRGLNFSKASFTCNGKWMYAYYDNSGKLLGIKQNIRPSQLPYYLQNLKQEKYSDYWITGLFELSNNQGYAYIMTIQNAEQTIVLKSKNGSDWNRHR